MNRKKLGFWHKIRCSVKSLPFKTYNRVFRLTLLALLTLITTLCIPALSQQRVEVTHQEIPQSSNTHSLLQQGINLYHAERFSEATDIFLQAASAFGSQGNSLDRSLVLHYLSLAYQHLGRWQEAESAIAQSLQLLNNQKNTNNTQAYLDVFAKALNTQGRLQWSTGRLSEALETWQQAAATYQQAGNEIGALGSSINQAEALQALGFSSRAEAQLQKLEQILQQDSDPNLKVNGLQSLGKALIRVGNLGKSQQVLRQSWEIAKQSHLKQAESSALLELGNTERALSNRAIALGNKEDEQKHTQAAIAFYQQVASSPTLQLQAQLNLLSLLVETGKWSQATNLEATIQQAIASLPPSQTNIYARINFAQSMTKLASRKKEKNAIASIAPILATALQQARSLQDKRAESYTLGQLGELYALTQQWSSAQELTQQALLVAGEIQAPDISYRWEWQLGRLLEQQGDINGAIASYNAAVEALRSVKGDLLSINADIQFSFRENVEPIYRKLVDLILRTKGNSQPSQENLQQAVEVIDSLRLAELESFLRCNLSQFVQLEQDLDRIDQTAAFLYPIILEDRLEVIVRLPGQSLKHYAAPIKRTEIEQTAIALRENILRRNRPEEVIKKATQLYEWLIAPLEQDLEKQSEVKTLVFVLDGVLRNIPMSVLYDGKRKEYLMQKRYTLAIVPELTLFDLRPLQRDKLSVLTAGVSEKEEIEGRSFNELPNVIEELQQIGRIVPSKTLLNPTFTKANLQQQIDSGAFSIVHIATHGKFSSEPEETFILARDRLLRSNDLNDLLRKGDPKSRQNVELLVLSACETAQGDKRATLGLSGIAVRAGSRSVLSTLWQVSDRSTAKFMERFYKQLTNPDVTKAEALHQAQLALFESYKAPYYWAPYLLVGNWL